MLTSAELNKLVNELTAVGYSITALLNAAIDSGETSTRLNTLREAAALVGNANSEVFHLYREIKLVEELVGE